MKIRIGPRTGLRTRLEADEHIPAECRDAVRSTYRRLLDADITPADARSIISTIYTVGQVALVDQVDAETPVPS